MRLWHIELLPYLPKLQLLSQYRELVAIIKRIDKQGTPNHILVNKVMNYNWEDFEYYSQSVVSYLKIKGYKINEKTYENFMKLLVDNCWKFSNVRHEFVFEGWHDERYLKQCLFNLQEKYDCGGIPKDEWKVIEDKFGKEFDLWEGED